MDVPKVGLRQLKRTVAVFRGDHQLVEKVAKTTFYITDAGLTTYVNIQLDSGQVPFMALKLPTSSR